MFYLYCSGSKIKGTASLYQILNAHKTGHYPDFSFVASWLPFRLKEKVPQSTILLLHKWNISGKRHYAREYYIQSRYSIKNIRASSNKCGLRMTVSRQSAMCVLSARAKSLMWSCRERKECPLLPLFTTSVKEGRVGR